MPTVSVAVVSGTAPFELATTIEVFGTDRSELSDDWYDFKLCAAQPGEIRTKAGLVLDTKYGVDDLVCADTVIVPAAGERPEGHGPLLDALRAAHAHGARIASSCTGAFGVAEAGLHHGRRATSIWAHAEQFARRYLKVTVAPNVLY